MTDDELFSAKHHGIMSPSGTFPDPTVWRYMDILSLFTLLQTERLHFTKLSELYRFDPNEGTGGLSIKVVNSVVTPRSFSIPVTAESIERNKQELSRVEAELKVALSMPIQKWKIQVQEWDKLNENVFISCWHTNENESDFMWRIYAKHEYGLAVTSYLQDLLDSFEHIGRDKIGYDYVVYPSLDILLKDRLHQALGPDAAFLIKHPDFQAERELRIFVRPKQSVKSCDLKVKSTEDGERSSHFTIGSGMGGRFPVRNAPADLRCEGHTSA